MNLIKFFQKYDTELKCADLFKEIRDKEGVFCKRCGGSEHYWLGTRDRYRCKACNWETTLRSGTALEYSKLPYQYWIYAMAILASSKKPVSALEMQRTLGHKFYEPIWAMLHKLRVTMGHRDASYKLKDFVEVDDAQFEVSKTKKETKNNKPGAGSKGKAKVAVQAQTVPAKDLRKKGKAAKGSFKFVKMATIENIKAESLVPVITNGINKNATIKTDGGRGYVTNKLPVAHHIKRTMKGKEAIKHLPWVHIMISNAKRNILGIYHSVKEEYLQNYLNEFCYMTNRRYLASKKLNNLLVLTVNKPWYLPYVQPS
jgi:transposase-like protein